MAVDRAETGEYFGDSFRLSTVVSFAILWVSPRTTDLLSTEYKSTSHINQESKFEVCVRVVCPCVESTVRALSR